MGDIIRRITAPMTRLSHSGKSAARAWNTAMHRQAQEPTRTGTKWGRGSVVLVGSLAVSVGMGFTIVNGALATSFNVGNEKLALHVDSLTGTGLGAVVATANKKGADNQISQIAVLRAALNGAELNGLCLTAVQDILGAKYTVQISAPGLEKAGGKNLIFDVETLGGTPATLSNAIIGRSADEIYAAGQNLGGQPGGFGLDVTGGDVNLQNVSGTAYAAQILGQLDVPKLNLALAPGEPDHC